VELRSSVLRKEGYRGRITSVLKGELEFKGLALYVLGIFLREKPGLAMLTPRRHNLEVQVRKR
jgi:hypothetical protein